MFKALKKKLKDQRGLTLVELLAVVVILGIIAAIAVPSITGIIQKSREDAVRADAVMALDAAKLYLAQLSTTDDSISPAELDPYLDNADFVGNATGGDATNWSISNTSGTLTLNATATAGSKTIKFVGATLAQINGAWPNGTAVVVTP